MGLGTLVFCTVENLQVTHSWLFLIHGSLAHADSTNPGLWNLDHVVFPTEKKKKKQV